MSASYSTLIPTLFGRGCIQELGEKVKSLGCTKALLVYDSTLPASMIEMVVGILEKSQIICMQYGDVKPELPDYTVKDACDMVNNCGGVDGIVALGGGSAMDTAKCINLMLNNPWPMSQYYVANGGGCVKNDGYPLILIPTTAGTGAELTVAAVVTDSGLKRPIKNPKCCTASLAIVDPELTLSMPRRLTAITGYDAFSHAFESYTSSDNTVTPVTEAVCIQAMKTIVEYLPKVLEDLNNIEYREKMAYAANLAGIGIGNAPAHKGHSIGHAIGSTAHVPHGISVACNLPYVAEHLAVPYYDKVKCVLEEVFKINVEDGTDAKVLGEIIKDAIRNFEKEIALPTLKDYGATREQIMNSKDLVLADGLFRIGRAPMSDEALVELLTKICDYYGLE